MNFKAFKIYFGTGTIHMQKSPNVTFERVPEIFTLR